MNKDQLIKAVLSLIDDKNIANEIRDALNSKSKVNKKNETRPQKTSNGYDIYYDETSGKAVGIVYAQIVFLKDISPKRLNWPDAAAYCRKIVINGVIGRLCIINKEVIIPNFKKKYQEIYQALKEIGATGLDIYSWGGEVSQSIALAYNLKNGHRIENDKWMNTNHVRPILDLRNPKNHPLWGYPCSVGQPYEQSSRTSFL